MLRLHCNAGRGVCVNESERTNLLLLKRLLDLLQIGEQPDVCADLQANQKPGADININGHKRGAFLCLQLLQVTL